MAWSLLACCDLGGFSLPVYLLCSLQNVDIQINMIKV